MTHRAGFVAILGRPNAGKSTLLNAMVGQKLAIVASRPQTTRTSIQGVLTLPDAQIVFVDTPGIHKSTTLLNRRMMDAVRSAAEAPDLALFVIDSLAPYSEHDSHAIDLLKKTGAPSIAVLNKVDRLEEKPRLLKLIERYNALHDFADYIPISASKGEGLDVLQREIVARLPEGPALYPDDYLTDQPERFLAAEIVREKILHFAHAGSPARSRGLHRVLGRHRKTDPHRGDHLRGAPRTKGDSDRREGRRRSRRSVPRRGTTWSACSTARYF